MSRASLAADDVVSRFVALNGHTHRDHYWPVDAPRTSPVLALHGFGATGFRTYRYVAPAFVEAGTALHAPDLLGFGESDAPEQHYSLHLYAALMVAYADAHDLQRPVLLGHSFGGKVAAAAAALHPERFSGLILVNPGGFTPFSRFLPSVAGHPWVAKVLRNDFVFERLLPLTPLGAVLQHAEHRRQWLRWRHSHAALDLDHTGLRPCLTALDLPTLIVWGRDDPLLPGSTARRAARQLGDAPVCYLDDAGHAPMKDCPEAFTEAVTTFLLAHAART